MDNELTPDEAIAAGLFTHYEDARSFLDAVNQRVEKADEYPDTPDQIKEQRDLMAGLWQLQLRAIALEETE